MIKILLLEDNPEDVKMIKRHLKVPFGFDLLHVDNEKDFRKEIENFQPDLILSDYYLPRFSGDKALSIRNKKQILTPFIIISDSINEETATDLMKQGATDYVSKSHLQRLPSAITHALEEAIILKKKRKEEKELKEREHLFGKFLENDISGDYMETEDEILFCNKKLLDLYGFDTLEELNKFGAKNLYVDLKTRIEFYIKLKEQGKVENIEVDMRNKKGATLHLIENAFVEWDEKGNLRYVFGYIMDVTSKKETELKLKESEVMFRSLTDNSPNGIIIAEPEGKIVYANEAVAKMTGFSKNELVSMTGFESLFLPEEAERNSELIKKQGQVNPRAKVYELSLLTKNGKKIITEFYTSTTKWKGKPLPLVMIRNLTKQKKAEVEIKMLMQAVEQSPVSIVITDLDGNVRYVNRYFTTLTQYSYDETIGKNPRILQSGKTPKELYVTLWKTIKAGKIWEGEFINRKKNGEEYIEKAIINPVVDSAGKIVRFIAVKEDITLKKEYQKGLVEAKEKAEEADLLKTNFLANISHELRTPMNGILGFSELIDMEDSMDTIKDMARYITESSLRLLNTLNLIIDYSIIGASKIKMSNSTLDVIKLINQIVKNYSILSKSKGIFLHFEPEEESLIIQCDGSILEKALTNLIDNAIKYTKKGGVSIGLNRTDSEADTIEIHIRDTGIGIAPEYHQIIFEPFRQVSEGYERNFEGMGLGLSVSRRFINALGGEISLNSQQEKGSDFRVTLPVEIIVNR